MNSAIVSIGHRNYIAADKIVSIVLPDSRPVKQIIQAAYDRGQLIDATQGKRTKSVIITTSNHVVLSANLPETIVERLNGSESGYE